MGTEEEGLYVTKQQKFELKTLTKSKVLLYGQNPIKSKLAEYFIYENLLPLWWGKTKLQRKLGKGL